MKSFVTMEPSDNVILDRRETRDSVPPPLVHCVLYYERHSRLALQAHPERKSLNFILSSYVNSIKIGSALASIHHLLRTSKMSV